MAKKTLPTNFQDDIITSDMGGMRRYKKKYNSDGTVSFEDVTTYMQVGGDYRASNANATCEAINSAQDASKILTTLEDVLACTQAGYLVDAKVIKAMVEG